MKKAQAKIYILDTNVLLYDPRALFAFEGATVGIPAIVLEQLDSFKKEGTDRGRATREVIRLLDELRQKGQLGKGVEVEKGQFVQVVFNRNQDTLSLPFKLDVEDNIILLTALSLKNDGYQVTFISKDLNARVKADALDIATEDYVHEHITRDTFYRGWRKVPVPAVHLKEHIPAYLMELHEQDPCVHNEFVWLESQHNPHNYRIFRYKNGAFVPVVEPSFVWPFSARNAQQSMAIDLLLDDSVKLVSLFGPAGTGKTFLALLVGLHEVLIKNNYEKMLIARPVVPLGRDIGFLPGTLQEKLYSWMLPVYDNIDFIVHSSIPRYVYQKDEFDTVSEEDDMATGRYKKKRHKKAKLHKHHKNITALASLDELMRRGKVSLEAITYMRGRSIPYQYIFIDEVQNLTPHEVKTLITRAGEGSKIILAGDPYQIDTPYLDFSSNGLVVSGEKCKGAKLFGSVYLEKSERGELSQLATELL
ncbi:MAG: PhoH family protein [Candidatus Babeliales bacterium]